jgi:hypothetical protein
MRFSCAVLLAVATLGWAQDTPSIPTPPPAPVILENTGKPMSVPFHCTDQDIQWAGLSCSEDEPCAIFVELTAVESFGSKIFAAGNIHSAATTLYSVLLASDDAGHTWHEPHDRIRGAGLDHIQFLDNETGWVSGLQLSPLPQDPFLLVTADGGKSWRQSNIFNENRESRTGSIQQFSLTGKSGSLIVDRGPGSEGDRYELYESPDSGETWTIKEESSKALKLKRPPPASADWRLRADASSKAFQVEHRQGERWHSVAAFDVKLGSCKPEPADPK